MRICIFEDSLSTNLFPLNYFRHTSELICGASTLAEKISYCTDRRYEISLHCRNYLRSYLSEKMPGTPVNSLQNDDYLFLNSRIVFDKQLLRKLLHQINRKKNFLFADSFNIVAFYSPSANLAPIKKFIEANDDNNLLSLYKLSGLKFNELNLDTGSTLNIINYPWDIIRYHANALDNDFDALFEGSKKAAKKTEGCYFINPKDIRFSAKSIVMPGVVLNASKGRIYISGSAVIEPFAYIEGPAYVGEGSTVRSGASIYGPVSIRNHSRISGEINHSIIHSYVNKQHLGYLGHSYLCEWVNLGAGTTTSNLKNNYSPVSVKLGGKPVDTGLTFLGSMVGDHTKTGINTMLNTGGLIGVSCNIFGSGYMPKSVRSFSWLDADRQAASLYEIEKSLNTARTTMNRRKVGMTGAYEELFRFVYAESKENLI